MHQTSMLSGTALNWAVAVAADAPIVAVLPDKLIVAGHFLGGAAIDYDPATNWHHAGPLIERELIRIEWRRDPYSRQVFWLATCKCNDSACGRTPQEAAMRAYVISRLGQRIDLPPELLATGGSVAQPQQLDVAPEVVDTWANDSGVQSAPCTVVNTWADAAPTASPPAAS